jgi:hypothetical protein
MRKVIIGIVVVLSLIAPGASLAQGLQECAKKIEQGLKAKDAKRRLKESINGGHYVDQQWAAGGQKVIVVINEYASPEEAAEMVAVAERSVAAVEVTGRLEGVGDYARYNTNRRGTYAYLILRKGSVVINIRATSLKSAKTFAKDIAVSID